MEMNVYFMPHVDIEELKKDEKLHIVQDGKGYLICLQENNEASIRTYNPEQYHDQFGMDSESAPLIRYMAEKYDLLIGGDGCMNDAGGRALHYGHSLPEDSVEILFEDYATAEMIEFRDFYGWSEEFILHLKDAHRKNREALGLKETYKVGDKVTLEYCGPDFSSCISGKVIFVDNKHILVHIPCYTHQLAADINRECLNYEYVEKITGVPVENIKKHEHDRFIDLADLATCLPMDTLGASISELGTIL